MARFAEAEQQPYTGHMLDLPKGRGFRCRDPLNPRWRCARAGRAARRLLGISRPPRNHLALRRQRGGDQRRDADGRSVAARQRQQNIAFNGEEMESAVERYRTGKVIPPRGTGTSSTYSQTQPHGEPRAGSPTTRRRSDRPSCRNSRKRHAHRP